MPSKLPKPAGACLVGACLVAAFLLTGCQDMHPEAVRNIVASPLDYLTRNFTQSKLPSNVADTVTQADDKPVPFNKLVLKLESTVDGTNTKDVHYSDTETYLNAGHGMVSWLEEIHRNDLPFSQLYVLSYRGMVPLRSERVLLNASHGNYFVEVKSFDNFTPIRQPGSGSLDYAFETGLSQQIANFTPSHIACEWGKSRPASDFGPKLTGMAYELNCSTLNKNGVQVNHNSGAYLVDYGISFNYRIETASYVSNFKVIDVVME